MHGHQRPTSQHSSPNFPEQLQPLGHPLDRFAVQRDRVQAAEAGRRLPLGLDRKQFPQGLAQLHQEGLAHGNRQPAQLPMRRYLRSVQFPRFSSPRKALIAASTVLQESITNQRHQTGKANPLVVAATTVLVENRLQSGFAPHKLKHLDHGLRQRQLRPYCLDPCGVHRTSLLGKNRPDNRKDDLPGKLWQSRC